MYYLLDILHYFIIVFNLLVEKTCCNEYRGLALMHKHASNDLLKVKVLKDSIYSQFCMGKFQKTVNSAAWLKNYLKVLFCMCPVTNRGKKKCILLR